MTPSVAEMRKYIRVLYPSASWRARVDKMSDQQVWRIYIRTTSLGGKK